ncbi:MAG: ROK family protein [Candidatus Omnitrophica bacterium]|nr:ROK family protein [Candidatus Omnitrophota bacterium]
MKQFVVGVDVGGTNVKLGIVDASSRISLRAVFSTRKFISSPRCLIKAISQNVASLLKEGGISKKSVCGIGIGLPGLVDVEKGIVRLLPNIPGWKNVPLKKILKAKTGLPVQIENDVNMMALGEWKYGAGQGYKNLICMTLGTGVGAGLILNNEIYRGPGFAAGEIGHAPLNEHGPRCGCGGYACFERYVGNAALQKWAGKVFHKSNITLEEVFCLAREGNTRALRFWQDVGTKVGTGLIGAINLLNPERIIIGGGVSSSFQFMAPAIRKVIDARVMQTQASLVSIIKAKLGDDAGLVGARVLISSRKY